MKEVKKYMEDKYAGLMRNYYYILLKQEAGNLKNSLLLFIKNAQVV